MTVHAPSRSTRDYAIQGNIIAKESIVHQKMDELASSGHASSLEPPQYVPISHVLLRSELVQAARTFRATMENARFKDEAYNFLSSETGIITRRICIGFFSRLANLLVVTCIKHFPYV